MNYVFFSGGKRGQRGGQTSAKIKQVEEHETARHTVLEKDIETLTQDLEDMSTTGVRSKVFQFFSCVSVYVFSFLIDFLLQNLNVISYLRKYSENTVLILIVFTN